MSLGLEVDIAPAMADLATIEHVLPAHAQRIIARAAATFEATARASTPVGKGKKAARQRLSTGWQRRVKSPTNIKIANVRPHAHLAAEGFTHVGGKSVAKFVPWIGQAIQERERMGEALTDLVGRGFPVALRALEVVP